MPDKSFEDRRRAPAEFKKIEDVGADDVRVSLIGTVVDVGEGKLVVDDGTGTIQVNFDLSEDLDELKQGRKVRIIGRPGEGEMDGEAVQDFSDFDMELYEKTRDKLKGIKEKL